METKFRRDANNSYLIIEMESNNDENYAVKMLINNKIPGIIETKSRFFDNQIEFHYNISSRVAMSTFYSQYKMGEKEIRGFVFGLSRMAASVKEYLLDINCVCLDYDMIFINPDTKASEFCYIPDLHREFFEDLRVLLQKLLAVVDYENRQAVEMAYGMQQIIINENYTVEELFKYINSYNKEDSNTSKENEKKLFEEELQEYFPTLPSKTENDSIKNKNVMEQKKKSKYNKKGIWKFIKNGFLKKDKLTDKTVDKTIDL